MLRGMYNAASALDAGVLNQQIVAENLAHATTPGFRRHNLIFESYADQFFPQQTTPNNPTSLTQVRSTGSYTSFENGPLQQTNNPLDLAINGDAFFVLDGPNGPLYTRDGVFSIGPTGTLVSSGGGYPVRGTGGPIQIPQNAGQIEVSQTGNVMANGVSVGSLQLARFDNLNQLRRVGTTLFEGPAPQVPPPGAVRVDAGYREGSNVQVVNEMISMILGFRYYEAAEKSLKAISDAVSQNTRPQ